MTPPPPIPLDELLSQAGWVRALARRLARDAQSADDLVQGTFAAALQRGPSPGRPLRAFLGGIVANLARQESRGRARRRAREREAASSASQPAPDQLLQELEEQQALARLVAELEEPFRSVVLRRYYRGQTAVEIARETGVAAGTVRSQLARGLSKLRARLEARAGGDQRQMLGGLWLAAAGTPEAWLMGSGAKAGIAATCALAIAGTLGWFVLRDDSDPLHPGPSAALARAGTSELVADTEVADVSAEAGRETLERSTDEESDVAAEPPAPPGESERLPSTISMRVLDEAGRGIPDTWLEVVTELGVPRDFPPSEPGAADGRIEWALPPGAAFRYAGRDDANVLLAVRAREFATHYFVGHVELEGHRDQGELTLLAGGGVAGRVLDRDGRPVPDALVIAAATPAGILEAARLSGPERKGGRPTTIADALGRFELSGVRAGEIDLWAHAPGFLWTRDSGVSIERGVVRPGTELVLHEVPPDARIDGLVVDPDGAPVAGARVVHVERIDWDEVSVFTDDAGRFRIEVTDRGPHELSVVDPEGRFGPSPVTVVKPGEEDVRIALAPRRELSVLTVNDAGEPILETAVWLECSPHELRGVEQVRTDEDGRCTLVAPGQRFKVTAHRRGHEHAESLELDPRHLPEELVLRLERHPTLRGIVLAGDEPVPGATVTLHDYRGPRFREFYNGFLLRFFSGLGTGIETDAEGRFELALRASRAEYRILIARKEGYAAAEVRILDPGEDVVIPLTTGGTLRGRVLVHRGRNPEGIVIAASRGDGYPLVTRTDAEGEFSFRHMTPGDWRVEDREVVPEGRVLSIAEPDAEYGWNAVVVEGQETLFDLDLSWQEDLRLTGHLRFDGRGATGWSATTKSPEHADRPYELEANALAEDGTFAARARPGHAVLVLRGPETSEATIRTDVVLDASRTPLELDLHTGSIRGEELEPRQRLRIHVAISEGVFYDRAFRADPEGRFHVSGVPAGTVSLQRIVVDTYGEGWRSLAEVEVLAGETVTLE